MYGITIMHTVRVTDYRLRLLSFIMTADFEVPYIWDGMIKRISMYIIAGLGNPEDKYRKTRHNMGFEILDELAKRHDIVIGRKEHLAMTGKGYINGCRVILAEPYTYMNNSGDSLIQLAEYYGIDVATELIVIYDDIDLPVGKLRLRPEGSAGGHNGIKSIIKRLGTNQFLRVRAGVGAKPDQMDLVDHVLGHFPEEDREAVKEMTTKACDAVESIISDGIERAMSRYN